MLSHRSHIQRVTLHTTQMELVDNVEGIRPLEIRMLCSSEGFEGSATGIYQLAEQRSGFCNRELEYSWNRDVQQLS